MNTQPNSIARDGEIFYVEFDHGHAYLSLMRVEGAAEVIDLYVEPEHRGKGLGSAYLAQLVSLAREKGAACIVAHVREDNVASMRAFEGIGFEPKDHERHMELRFPGCRR